MNKELLLNDFAIRAFRNTADYDYIHARMAYKGKLIQQFLWSSLQAIEKYLKCIHLLNRIDTRKLNHNLIESLKSLENNAPFQIRLRATSRTLIEHLNTYGKDRYLINSYFIEDFELQKLDMAVWDIRRYCNILNYAQIIDDSSLQKLTNDEEIKKIIESENAPPQHYKIEGGIIENIIADMSHPARKALVWNNLSFGTKARKCIKTRPYMHATNSPLFLNPEIRVELEKYVKIT